jgi:iron complex transport system permease protein
MTRHRLLTLLLLMLVPACLLFAVLTGSVPLNAADLWQVLRGQEHGLNATLILDLRLPRALSAFAVGGLLALAGALLQVLLRNPLADPYILGVSGGAAVGALGSLLLGLGSTWVSGSAFAGSLVTMLLVFGLSHTRGVWTQTRLLLTGVVVATGWGAVISVLLVFAPTDRVQGMLFWLMGDLSQATRPGVGLAVLAMGVVLLLPLGRALNLYARGEQVAAALGENVAFIRRSVYVAASLLTATAVTLAGSVGFVGLIVPHLLRLLGETDYRRLLPNAVLLGGSFMLLADTLARSLLAPMQLPVGTLTALLGTPVFLYLLTRGPRT